MHQAIHMLKILYDLPRPTSIMGLNSGGYDILLYQAGNILYRTCISNGKLKEKTRSSKFRRTNFPHPFNFP